MKNVLLTIKYDGTPFCGWQRQPNVETVQGEVERVLSILCAQQIEINGTSRTDAGVHAYGQQASFKGDFKIPVENIKRAANNLLHPAVKITEVMEVPEEFHARFDSKGKTYEYIIINSRNKDPFMENYCYFVDRPLDIDKIKRALKYIEGTHDFNCFQASGGEIRETTVRTVYKLEMDVKDLPLEEEGNALLAEKGLDNSRVPGAKMVDDHRWFPPKKLIVKITGDGFLYNMVRIIVGTLVDVGYGKIDSEDLPEIIQGRDRTKAGHTAPAQGLYLKEIYYRTDFQDYLD